MNQPVAITCSVEEHRAEINVPCGDLSRLIVPPKLNRCRCARKTPTFAAPMKIFCLLLVFVSTLFAQRRTAESASAEPGGRARTNSPAASTNTPTATYVDEKPAVTRHEIELGGKTLNNTATAAQMPIVNANGDTEAHIFYMAYTLDGAGPSKRPLTFAFNGGPGSASIWVHMGAMGPRRVKLLDDGNMPPPPYTLVDNENTWLDQTDLVFIDPVGTGFSRAKTPDLARRFNGVQGDLQSVGEFIRMYLTRNSRWLSPLFVAGESYGTFRAAGLAGNLIEQGIAFNGVVLISTVLNFESLRPSLGNGVAYALHLPTFTADAWFHKRLPSDLQQKDLKGALKEAEEWAMTGYVTALQKGDLLSDDERKAVVEKLARYTGLEARYIDNSEMRISVSQFTRELLRDKKLTIGRYDGRLTGPSPLNSSDRAEYAPVGHVGAPALHGGLSPLHSFRSSLHERHDLSCPRRRHHAVGLGNAKRLRRHQRSIAQCIPEESAFEGAGAGQLLRPRDTLSRCAVHLKPHGHSSIDAQEYHMGLL